MAHKIYSNLAHLETFSRDLNYTGVPLDGWGHPTCLIPLVFGAFALLTAGLPRGILSYWALFNFCIIHPMDLFVGTLGMGPKYLVDEYAILDSRYWVVQDACVTIVSALEFFVMAPLCYLWYRSIVKNKWDSPFFASMASTWHMIGTLFYFFGEIYEGCVHLPGHDFQWPPKFDTYVKVKYFWIVFVFLNWIWIIVPTTIIFRSYNELERMANKQKKN